MYVYKLIFIFSVKDEKMLIILPFVNSLNFKRLCEISAVWPLNPGSNQTEQNRIVSYRFISYCIVSYRIISHCIVGISKVSEKSNGINTVSHIVREAVIYSPNIELCHRMKCQKHHGWVVIQKQEASKVQCIQGFDLHMYTQPIFITLSVRGKGAQHWTLMPQ